VPGDPADDRPGQLVQLLPAKSDVVNAECVVDLSGSDGFVEAVGDGAEPCVKKSIRNRAADLYAEVRPTTGCAPRSVPVSTSAIQPSVVAPEMKAGPLYPIVINPSRASRTTDLLLTGSQGS
jgi:hypothetical protein